MATMFTVGEMAKLSNLSKQTLIFYDRKGVFSPNYVDPENGYRYYSADQLELLDNILILKEMGLSLEEIKHFMENRSVGLALSIMKEQQEKMSRRLERIKKLQKKLADKIAVLEQFQADENHIVLVEKREPEYLLLEPVEEPGGLLQQDLAQKRLLRRARKNSYPYYYQIGTMFSRRDMEKEGWDHASYMFLTLEGPVEDPLCWRKDCGQFIRGYHTGPYQEAGNTYKKIWKTADAGGYHPGEYAYEYCILDSLTSRTSREYVTELQIPVTAPLSEFSEKTQEE